MKKEKGRQKKKKKKIQIKIVWGPFNISQTTIESLLVEYRKKKEGEEKRDRRRVVLDVCYDELCNKKMFEFII